MPGKWRVALQGLMAWGLVLLADFIFYDKPVGWLAGVFACAWAWAYWLTHRPMRHPRSSGESAAGTACCPKASADGATVGQPPWSTGKPAPPRHGTSLAALRPA